MHFFEGFGITLGAVFVFARDEAMVGTNGEGRSDGDVGEAIVG